MAVCAYSCTIIHKTHGQHQQYYDDYQYSVTDIFGRAFVAQLLLGKIYALLLASSFDGDTDVVYAVALFLTLSLKKLPMLFCFNYQRLNYFV